MAQIGPLSFTNYSRDYEMQTNDGIPLLDEDAVERKCHFAQTHLAQTPELR